MTKTYGATNPQGIIDLFEMRAKIADVETDRATSFEARLRRAQAVTWREAANILRNTEFVGWSNDTRIVEEIKFPDISKPTATDDYEIGSIVQSLETNQTQRDDIFGDPMERGGHKDPICRHGYSLETCARRAAGYICDIDGKPR